MQKIIVLTLVAICVIGIIGIPMGDPKFFVNAIGLELAFITLSIISFKKLKAALIPNIVISCVVIVGNTISPQHVEIMSSFHPIGNAIVLIIGGYILQGLLLCSSIVGLKKQKMQEN